VFLFLFSRKKKKGLKGFMVLVGTADSLAEHTLYEYKLSCVILYLEVFAGKSENDSHLCHLKSSDLLMTYAVFRMKKVKSAGLKGMQFHNQRERKSRTNDDIDHERTRENYDLKNDKNINYNARVKEIIESQKTGTRKTRKDAVLVNELLVTSDRECFQQLGPGEQKRSIEASYKSFSARYGKKTIAYATVHNDEQTPHMHLGVVPMRDGKLQGKNVFNRQELLWLQDKFPVHMKKQGFELKRGE